MTVSTASTYHHGNLRQALLEVALRHLQTLGPDKISLRALAREVGVSQTAPYRHFDDKNALLAALAEDGYRRLTAATTLDARAPGDAVERLYRSGLCYIRFAQEHPELYKLMFGPVIEQPLSYPALQEAGSEAFNVILELVQAGIASGAFAEENPQLLAMSCWAMVHGIASLLIDGMYECSASNLNAGGQVVPATVLVQESLRLALQGVLRR